MMIALLANEPLVALAILAVPVAFFVAVMIAAED